MIRSRLWSSRGGHSVCLLCRHRCPSPPRRCPPRRQYSDSHNGNNGNNGSSSSPEARLFQSGAKWTIRPRTPPAPGPAPSASKPSTPSTPPRSGSDGDVLLPHERAARAGLSRSAPPLRDEPSQQPPPPRRPGPSFPFVERRSEAGPAEPFPLIRRQAVGGMPMRPLGRSSPEAPLSARSPPTGFPPRPPPGSRDGFAERDDARRPREWSQLNRRRESAAAGPGETQGSASMTDLAESLFKNSRRATDRKPPPQLQRLDMLDSTASPPSEKPAPKSGDRDEFWAQFKDRVRGAPGRDEGKAEPASEWNWVEEEEGDVEKRAQDRQTFRDEETKVRPPPADTREIPVSRREPQEKRKKKPQHRRTNAHRDDEGEDEFDYEEYVSRAEERRRRKEEKKAQKQREHEATPTPILLPQFINISNLADALRVKVDVFLDQLAELGFENINEDSIMTGETAALIAQEYGFEPRIDTGNEVDLKPRPPPEDPTLLPPRPPIVTIMGHVDHGKTTMLDWLRKSSVAAQEHGGITQHIGAFSVRLTGGRNITFLDTPGHAAFLTMRQRGANVTDIVILVVAADDSVKPQTLEALKHARSAKVPIIVAINKIDKDEARIDNVKADLSRHGIEIEDYGGDVQVVCVSGKTGQGMEELEENILTLSEILDVRAESDGMAEGWVLESSVKPIGRVATILVKRGTLRIGDYIVGGTTWAKIRMMRNEAGVEVAEAPPGAAVEILGWKDPPTAGDQVLQSPDEAKAKDAADYREEQREREKAAAEVAAQEKKEREERERAELAERGATDAPEEDESGTKIVNFVVRGDVMGSVEAVCASIMEIGNNEVRPRILRSLPGQINESDVDHAATSKSYIVNFSNPIPGHIKRMAEEAGVNILDHTVIYHLSDDVKDKLSERLTDNISHKVVGEAEVLQVFPINLRGRVYKNIAGCRVRNGQVSRSAKYRVVRNGQTIFDGALDSLKQGKKDVGEMKKGAECGISFDDWQDFQVGDQIQAYDEIREKRHL